MAKSWRKGSQFSLKDVEVITATVNLDDVRAYRGAKASRAVQASKNGGTAQIDVDFDSILLVQKLRRV